jgi:CheY-like chemotaxis protein
MACIIVASEDLQVTGLLAAELSAEGHDVLEACSGLEVTELAGAATDMIFLDVALPVFDGFETAARLRKNPDLPPKLPIVFLSAHELDPRQCDALGIAAVLPKAHSAGDVREITAKCLYAR